MFAKKSSLYLFFLACLVHALTFIYFVGKTVSTALDGSHRESFGDWLPFLLFLATFAVHFLVPGLRATWKAAPAQAFILLILFTGVLSFLLTSVLAVQF